MAYPNLPNFDDIMTERTNEKMLMNAVQRLLGLPVTDPEDRNNSYIRFFLKEVRYGFGPNRALVNCILEVRASHRELAAFLAWMKHKARKHATPTRKNIADVTALYKHIDMRLFVLLKIHFIDDLSDYTYNMSATEIEDARLVNFQDVCRRSHSAMNDAMELMYSLPEKEQVGGLRFKAVDDPTDPDVLFKFFVCEFTAFGNERVVRSGVPGFIFFAPPPELGSNGEDFNFVLGLLQRRDTTMRENCTTLMELLYDVRQSFVEFAAITAAMDVVEPATERERYRRKERRDLYGGIHAKLLVALQGFRADRDRADDPRLDCPTIQRRLKEILLLTSSCCHVAGSLAQVLQLREPEAGPLCRNRTCNAPGRLATLSTCSRCKEAAYCCRECQTEDWPEHKSTCRAPPPGKKGMAPQCANCAAEGVGLSPCSVCKLVQYCGKACQTQHWKAGQHKKFCVAPADRRPGPVQGAAAEAQGSAQGAAAANPCPVCMETLDGKAQETLRCGHILHPECSESIKAFGVCRACPVCRTPEPWLSKKEPRYRKNKKETKK